MEKEILNILSRLEHFRKDIETGKINPGCNDWIIRMCQAEVAQGYFEHRMDWTEKIK
ncbi:hypothetical protein [Siminovitchia fordii]|uniref:Phage protein n=1 Tax=Siminovitchia fordii TaxID=254759 RepID=A0ABQ4KA83_9BACI|nr:hypothetical protein [Siminovitchia fordii]GIN22632.1 hypothetical protein J1TS3_37660 [Siminovitchia fordii]